MVINLLIVCVVKAKSFKKRNLKLIKSPTIVITGASSGIGRAFALFFAKQTSASYKLVLVARRQKELEELRAEILAAQSTSEVEIRQCDMGRRADIDELLASLQNDGLGCVVNAAGITHQVPAELWELPQPEIDAMLQLMVLEATYFIKKCAEIFKAQNHGLFVQMSSGTGIYGCPMLSVYSSLKNYLNVLLRQINAEFATTDVRFVSAAPMWVSTPMTMTTKVNTQFISPDKFVSCLFNKDFRKQTVINPYWYHRLVVTMTGLMSEKRRGATQYKHMKITRKGILRKLEKQKKQQEIQTK